MTTILKVPAMKYESPKYAIRTFEQHRDCVAAYAPKGQKIGVIVRREGNEFCIRLFSASTIGNGAGGLPDIVRIDHLLGEGIVNELSRREQNNGIASIVGGVGYWGWEATDGSKTSGLRVAALNDGRTGFAHGIVYTLAAIVHGDRKAWGHMRLDRF